MPSLLTVVRMSGLQLALNAFLDAHDVVRLWRTARPFRALRVVHLRIVDDGPAVRRWRTRQLIEGGLRTLALVDCDLRAEQLVDLCGAVRARGVLEKLHLNSNALLSKEAGKALAGMLAANTVLTDLDVSDNRYDEGDGPGFAQELAVGLGANGALVKFTIADNGLQVDGGKALADALTNNHIMTELNIASNHLGRNSSWDEDMTGVIAICDALPTMGALVSANILHNGIRIEQAQNLATILKEHPTLASLCGNMGDEAELDMSDMELVADDAILLAPEIAAYGARTSLNISNNSLGGYYDDDDAWRSDMTGIKDVAAALSECKYVRG